MTRIACFSEYFFTAASYSLKKYGFTPSTFALAALSLACPAWIRAW